MDLAVNPLRPAAPVACPTSALDAAREQAHRNLRVVADQVVGSVFYGTLLQQLRASSLQGLYGHGGRGEQVFQAQLDQILAERAGQARTFDLSAALVRDLIDQQTHVERAAASAGAVDSQTGSTTHTRSEQA